MACAVSALVLVVVVLILGFQAVTRGKKSCHMHNTPQTPNIFTYSGPPIKLDGVGPVDNRASSD